MAGCGGGDSTPAGVDPTGGVSGDTVDWGPLAIIDSPGDGGSDQGLGTGAVHIDDECVTIQIDEGRVATLAFPSGRVAWVEAEQSIEISGLPSGRIVLGHGDRISIAGVDELGKELVWLNEPAPSCPSLVYAVDGITLLS